MGLYRLDSRGSLVPADAPRPDTRHDHRDPSRSWRSTARWQRLRAAQVTAQPWCSLCGSEEDLTADHIVPVKRGGALFDPANLDTLCRRCNSAKGSG